MSPYTPNEEFELIPHRKIAPSRIRKLFEKSHLYSAEFIHDLEEGLKKTSLCSRRKKKQ